MRYIDTDIHYGTFIIYWCIQEGEGLLHACISSPRANGVKRRSGRKPGARVTNPRANGAKRRSGRKPGARVTNFVLY